MPTLFDPYRCLVEEYRARPSLAGGRIVLRFEVWWHPSRQDEAWEVVGRYEKLLRLQLENNGASVQKLLAHGKARLRAGRLEILGEDGRFVVTS